MARMCVNTGESAMRGVYAVSLAALVAGTTTPALAQDGAQAMRDAKTAQDSAASSAAQTEQPDSDFADIIVTAQKREQSLQDVPVVVTVLSADQLENAGVRDIKDLQTITPGLNVTSSTSQAQTSIRVRGVGTIGDNPGLESSVGTIVDGVYRARSSVAFGDLGALDRIEILKGPQSTLFGKNMSAGVINVVTSAPSFTPRAEFLASYGNYNAWTVSADATMPLIDDVVAGRFFAIKRQRDGFLDVRTGNGPRQNTTDVDEDYYVVRGQLLLQPAAGLSIRLIGDYADRRENCCLDTPTVVGPTAGFIDLLAPDAGIVRPADPFSRLTYANRETPTEIRDSGFSADVQYDIGGGLSLTSITAWRNWRGANGTDLDYSTADIWYRPVEGNVNTFKVFSQEVRLAYSGGIFNSILGGFYSNERLESRQATFFGSDYERYLGLLLSSGANPNTVSALTGLPVGSNFVANQGQSDSHQHRASSAAIFSDNSFTITDGLELSLGLRYTDEVKNLRSQYTNTVPAAACAAARARPIPAAAVSAICAPNADSAFNNIATTQRRTERRVSGSAKLAYRFSPEAMVYGSYANGFKSGGFNLDRGRFGPGIINPNTDFAAETVESYEIGAKTTLFGRQLLANIAGFYQTYKGFQLNTYTGISWLVASIPEVTSKGADFDLLWNTGIPGLTINAGATYADTRYGQFTPPAGISARLPGATLSYAPKWNVTGGFASRTPLTSDFDLTASASVKWSSEYNTGSNLDPFKIQGAYAMVNARIGFGPHSEAWTLELWSQNLTNAHVYQVVVDQPLQSGTYGAYLTPPRTYGVTGRVRF
jgi:outer membrane receptor protein involved in Fe transport